MARFINAYKLQYEIDKWLDSVGNVLIGKGLSYYGELMGCIEDTPTADVVSVVRCEECVFWDTDSKGFSGEHICKMHSVVSVHSRYTNPTDYCSYGERRCKQ